MPQGPAGIGEKEIKTNWPHETGLIAETTKQEGRQSNLVAEKGSLVRRAEKELL